MKRLDRYLLRELLVPFLIGTIAIVLMFQANTYMALAKTLNLEGVPAAAVLKFILWQTPSYLNFTLPTGTALATSLAMSRLVRESELTAIRATGTRILRTIWPFMFAGLLVALANFYLVERVIPKSSREANNIGRQIGALGALSTFQANVSLRIGKYNASFGSIARQPDDSIEITDALLIERPAPERLLLITAKSGTYRAGVWTLRGAFVRQIENDDLVSAKPRQDVIINERILLDELFSDSASAGEEQTIAELQSAIANAKQVGADSKPLEVQLMLKFSVPAACIVFALTGPVFAVYFARAGGFVGVLLSIVMVLVYYNAFVISSEILAKMPQVPAWVAAWLPNMLFAVMGLVAVRRLE